VARETDNAVAAGAAVRDQAGDHAPAVVIVAAIAVVAITVAAATEVAAEAATVVTRAAARVNPAVKREKHQVFLVFHFELSIQQHVFNGSAR
jgi:hypothetical protein